MFNIRVASCIPLLMLAAACGDPPAAQTYAIQGTVSGLTGTVTLQNNQQDLITLSTNGPFILPTKLVAGATYAVSVNSHPTGQVCTVVNAAGTIASANVSNLTVQCGPQSYVLGGRATGLSGSVTLTNGADTVTVAQNGVFTFPTALAVSAPYSVAIQGDTGDQACSLAGAAALMGTADTYSVTLSCTPKKYLVGGSVTGLTGSLTLQNNHGDSLSVSADGNFTFATALVTGAHYSVTAPLSPQGLACTVTQGQGTIAAASVIDVVVSCAPAAYQVGGVASGLMGPIDLLLNGDFNTTVSVDGVFSFAAPLHHGDLYNVEITSQHNGTWCTVANANGAIGYVSVNGVSITCAPILTFVTSQAANVVIGQPDFVSGANPLVTDSNTLYEPYGNPAYADGSLYISDYARNRVLVFDGVPTTNQAEAAFLIGQADFAADSYNPTDANTLYGPTTVSTDGNHFAVVDYFNYRVLLYDTLPQAPGGFVSADLVLGQAGDFTANNERDNCSLGADSFGHTPESVRLAAGRLLVSDAGHNRVLIWNSVPTSTAELATPDIILGAFTATSADCGNEAYPPTGASLAYPSDVWTDGTRLIIADSDNNRVLIWNHMPTQNYQAADVVLGQPDMMSNSSDTTRTTLSYPENITATANQLFVADSDNNRVLIWNTFPTVNNAPPDVVLGQTPNDLSDPTDDPFTYSDSSTTAQGLNYPAGLLLVGSQLIVVDDDNNRVLIYNAR